MSSGLDVRSITVNKVMGKHDCAPSVCGTGACKLENLRLVSHLREAEHLRIFASRNGKSQDSYLYSMT